MPSAAITVPTQVIDKIKKHAFSGGGATLEDHKANGGNPDVDVPYQYLTFFHEDDEYLKKLYDGYKAGTVMTGEMKQALIDCVNPLLAEQKKRNDAITPDILRQFMSVRRLEW